MPAPDLLPTPPRRIDAWFTPGQRWSAAVLLALALALAVAQPVTRVGGGSLLSPAPADVQAAAGTPSPPPSAAGPTESSVISLPGSAGPASGGSGGAVPVLAEEPSPPAMLRTPPKVVALVKSGDGTLPGRDDAAIAGAFLETAPFPVTVLTIPADPDPAFCGRVAAAGPVAVTSFGVDPQLRDCLLGAGVVLVGFDTLGEAARPPDGRVVSTRRGVGQALDDLTAWARRGRALRGRVGVVGTTATRAAVTQAVARMRDMGFNVVATAFVGDRDETGSDISDGVRSFAGAGVQVVVFAAPVTQQARWVALQSLLSPSVRYVVADAYDAVVAETYPPSFDGALAHTSVRVSWFAREHGETPDQRVCRTRWEAKAAPPSTLGAQELARAFAWCQHVALVAAALEAYNANGGAFHDVLRSVRLPSPLTSDLGPLPGGSYGPLQDAVLVWRAMCGCWQEERSFADRGS